MQKCLFEHLVFAAWNTKLKLLNSLIVKAPVVEEEWDLSKSIFTTVYKYSNARTKVLEAKFQK